MTPVGCTIIPEIHINLCRELHSDKEQSNQPINMTICDAIAAAEGSPSNNINTTPQQSSNNASTMSTDHSLSIGAAVASQTPVHHQVHHLQKFYLHLHHPLLIPICYTAITCQYSICTTSTASAAEVTASSELEHVDNGEEVELEVTAKLVESFNSIRIL